MAHRALYVCGNVALTRLTTLGLTNTKELHGEQNKKENPKQTSPLKPDPQINVKKKIQETNSSIANEISNYFAQDDGISYLCLDENASKKGVKVCDKSQESIFACLTSIDRQVKLCEKFIYFQTALPICLREKTSEVVTCKYENRSSSNICFPIKNSIKISTEGSPDYKNSSQKAFAICTNETRFTCLKHGKLSHCDKKYKKHYHDKGKRKHNKISSFDGRLSHRRLKSGERKGSYKTGKGTGTTDDSKSIGLLEYFHVIKCDDCSIDHKVNVDDDAYSVSVRAVTATY